MLLTSRPWSTRESCACLRIGAGSIAVRLIDIACHVGVSTRHAAIEEKS